MKTKSSKHTSGQWSVNHNSTTLGVAQICADEKHHVIGIADCFQGEASTHGKKGKYVVSEKEMLANAHLIAAAPELLKALKQMVALHAGQEHLYGLTNSGEKLYKDCDAQATAAITMAEGK